MATASESGKLAAPYISWATFKNSVIDHMIGDLPNAIDKSIFKGLAGGVQTGLITSLKFLGLINDKGTPSGDLQKLTSPDETERKAALVAILHARYAELFAIGLERATIKQLFDVLENSYGVTGDTREKAARFFISAAQYAGIQLSRHIGEGVISQVRRRKERKAQAQESASEVRTPANPLHVTPNPSGGEARAFQLASTTLTISASIGVMSMSRQDRDFVGALLDQLDEYEKKGAANPKPGAE